VQQSGAQSGELESAAKEKGVVKDGIQRNGSER